MFGLFGTPDVQHAALGTLQWKRGAWRGSIHLPGHSNVPLVIEGTRKGPAPQALEHALRLGADYARHESRLKHELFDHYQPCADALRDDSPAGGDTSVPRLRSPDNALQAAMPEAVAIIELGDEWATEICYRVPWDEEHTLGARFRGPQWIELCGSTLVP